MTALRRVYLAARHVMAEPVLILAALIVGIVALLARQWVTGAVALAVAAAGWASATRPVRGAPDDCPLCAVDIEEAGR